jgi:CheY-like chemotaxis protein
MVPVRKTYQILVAEDDDGHREALRQMLAPQGWSVHAAATGAEALDLAQRLQIDFSIFDLHMPGLSGIETLKLIHQQIRPLPCILISGAASKQEQMQALAAGAFSFLQKPVPPEILRYVVGRLIQRYFVKT